VLVHTTTGQTSCSMTAVQQLVAELAQTGAELAQPGE